MKSKKHGKHHRAARAGHSSRKESRLHQHVPFIAVIATIVLVVLGLGVWLQSAVAGLAR